MSSSGLISGIGMSDTIMMASDAISVHKLRFSMFIDVFVAFARKSTEKIVFLRFILLKL
jgi:hypothetical protein